LSANNRASEYKSAKEKDTARTVCICMAVISFVLLILAVAMPSMYKKYNDKAEKETIGLNVTLKDSTPLIYTVQAGSFDSLQRARKLYDSIISDLTEEDVAYLRIEKVGQYYAVRIGKFGEWSYAERFHERIRSQLSTAILVEAYIKEERIKKLHTS